VLTQAVLMVQASRSCLLLQQLLPCTESDHRVYAACIVRHQQYYNWVVDRCDTIESTTPDLPMACDVHRLWCQWSTC